MAKSLPLWSGKLTQLHLLKRLIQSLPAVLFVLLAGVLGGRLCWVVRWGTSSAPGVGCLVYEGSPKELLFCHVFLVTMFCHGRSHHKCGKVAEFIAHVSNVDWCRCTLWLCIFIRVPPRGQTSIWRTVRFWNGPVFYFRVLLGRQCWQETSTSLFRNGKLLAICWTILGRIWDCCSLGGRVSLHSLPVRLRLGTPSSWLTLIWTSATCYGLILTSQIPWTLPRCFETVLIDRQVLKQATEAKADDLDAVVQQHLFNDDIDQALSHWSQEVENGFAEASCDVEGQHVPLGRKYFGRCAQRDVKWVHLAQPRPRSGRPGDFCPKYLTSDLHSRRMVRQTRRLSVCWKKAIHTFMGMLQGYGIVFCRQQALHPRSLVGWLATLGGSRCRSPPLGL